MSLSGVGQQSSPNSGTLEKQQMSVSELLMEQPSSQPFLGMERWNCSILVWPLRLVTNQRRQLKSRCFTFSAREVGILVHFHCWDLQEI